MVTFPLTLLHLAMMLAFELPDFMTDLRYDKRTLMVRLGWERGMQLHNLLILLASLMLGVSMLFGLPPAIGLPAMLFLPLGLFQIWLMLRIAAGARPNWNILGLMAILVFGMATYLLTFGFWTR
jgi:1,4-dihydroxy-2-naphthoate octaprenyltransferase